MKRKKLIPIFLSFLFLTGCANTLRPGAVSPADQAMFDTLYFTQVFIEEVRPKVLPCSSENSHPECGSLGSKAQQFNLIVETYNDSNDVYQGWKESIARGESVEVANVEAVVGAILMAIRADSLFWQVFNSIRD